MTVIFISAGFTILGVMGLYPLVIIAAGLWRLVSWARLLTVICLWFAVIVLPIGVLSPFNAGDIMLAGKDPPSPLIITLKLLPIIVAGLWGLHVLGKYRGEFKRRLF
jgi:hypothetical protein